MRRLIADPLKNVRRIRDTSTRFLKPNFVSFDAFGTLYTPKAPVHEQYHEVALELGIDKSLESIKYEFPRLHHELLKEFPNYGKGSGKISTSEEWWLELIVRLFNLSHYSKDTESKQFCDKLIKRFETSEGYSLYDDVIPTFTELQERGISIIVSSNSDPRLYGIVEGFGLDKFIDNIYLSYDLGDEKPNKAYFDKVVNSKAGVTLARDEKSSYLSNCWHVGDGHDKDYMGAVKAGWNGIFLDRLISSRYFTKPIPDPEADTPSCITKPFEAKSDRPVQILANNRVIISDLTQLPGLFYV